MLNILINFAIVYLAIIAIYSFCVSWKHIKCLGFSFWAVGEFLITFFFVAAYPIVGMMYPLWKNTSRLVKRIKRINNELETKIKS